MAKRFRSKEYIAWRGMMVRCYNEGNLSYRNYGGRGIKVCLSWHNYTNFLQDMGVSPPGTQLDRRDNEAGYFKENCRWASPAQNSQNRRNNKLDERKVKLIRALMQSIRKGVTKTKAAKIIAAVFETTVQTIFNVVDKQTWK